MDNFYKHRTQKMCRLFDDVAEDYETYRLTYPDQLYEDIFCVCDGCVNALEIGIGTGKATLPFLRTSMRITGIDPNPNMLEIARRKFYAYENLDLVNTSFENFEAHNIFDLIYAASSFQWLRSENRLKDISKWLKHSGYFVRFKTVTLLNRDTINNAILYHIYERLLPTYIPKEKRYSKLNESTYDDAGFVILKNSVYKRDIEFSILSYIKFINTYTEYIALPLGKRKNFENEIRRIIPCYATINLTQKCTLIIAQKK